MRLRHRGSLLIRGVCCAEDGAGGNKKPPAPLPGGSRGGVHDQVEAAQTARPTSTTVMGRHMHEPSPIGLAVSSWLLRRSSMRDGVAELRDGVRGTVHGQGVAVAIGRMLGGALAGVL